MTSANLSALIFIALVGIASGAGERWRKSAAHPPPTHRPPIFPFSSSSAAPDDDQPVQVRGLPEAGIHGGSFSR